MEEEELVMTPTKQGKTTSIKLRKKRKAEVDTTQVAHVAGGQHKGIVINKKNQQADDLGDRKPDLQLEFKCFLVDKKTGQHVPELRQLKFWFAPDTEYLDRVTSAYEFFKLLVKPEEFPRDYVGFVKKNMKLAQLPRFRQIKAIDVDLEPLDIEAEQPPVSPAKKEENKPKDIQVQDRLLMTLESAYPNILPMEDLASMTEADQQMLQSALTILKGKNLIMEKEPGKFVRKVLDTKTEVKDIQEMHVMQRGQKPSIAIITSKYNEKLAVDAMMADKTTFVNFKTEGESKVYTIGYIGKHKVVSTKLPMIGRQREAQIASGSTTTQLLGTFGEVEHVMLVGSAGSVPHYADFYSHGRMGDVVVSAPNNKGADYIFCDKIKMDEERGQMSTALKSWYSEDHVITDIACKLMDAQRSGNAPGWDHYIKDAQDHLEVQQADFSRPPAANDRLYMNIGGSDVIEVGHPPVPDEASGWFQSTSPVLRVGPIGAGKPIMKDSSLRADFCARHQCVCLDGEFDQVLESIRGNRKESFALVRGYSDYLDGSQSNEWQPYAALAAAAVCRTIIEQLASP